MVNPIRLSFRVVISRINTFRRSIESIYEYFKYADIKNLDGSPVEKEIDRIDSLLKDSRVIKQIDWKPSYSVFDSYNGYLVIYPVDSISDRYRSFDKLTRAFDGLLNRTEYQKSSFVISNIDSIGASKSNTPENRDKWDTIYDFGQWAFEFHLPGSYSAPKDITSAIKGLHGVFQRAIVNQREGFRRVIRQRWCNRTLAANSGISRRLSAIVYLARSGDMELQEPFDIDVCEEELSSESLTKLNAIADHFVIIASVGLHLDLQKLFRNIVVPMVISKPRCEGLNEITPLIYSLPKRDQWPRSIDKIYEGTNQTLLQQAESLKLVLDRYVTDGTIFDLTRYIEYTCQRLESHPAPKQLITQQAGTFAQ